MSYTSQLAQHLRQVYFGGNWTCSNLKQQLDGISFQEAMSLTPFSANSIAALTCHIHYYIKVQLDVMNNKELHASDIDSWKIDNLGTPADWETLLGQMWIEAKQWADLVEKMNDARLETVFTDTEYGTWQRNLLGLIEHTHYHLGQIALIRGYQKRASQNSE
ncbi:MAG: DinB family protein [Bacteroidetes bacterium]|nr:DinB family protein [Bacteroidota bacterium]